jgi:D-alanyl-D-alanine carboxypeptidase
VSPAAAPSGVALPSPQFRTVTKGRPGTYRVNVGDSVATIVARFGVTRDELYRLNGLEATSQLQIGQVLQVPAPGDRAQSQSPGPRKVREISPGWVGSEHAVVIDADSGEILWARDPNTPIAPASLTKIVTALVTLEHANLSDTVTTRVDSRRMTDSTVMGLYPGEEVTVEDLLYGLMLPSGNDAALALAQYVAGTREAFADLMNEKARSLGLTGSHFVNPHGLDTDGHVSTPYDMAMLARAGMRDPTFRALAAAKMYETPRGKGYTLYNLNRLLMQYPGADGVKIGFTDAAGRAIVGSAMRDGHRVIVAMMRSPDIYADSATLLDWAFSSYSWDPE